VTQLEKSADNFALSNIDLTCAEDAPQTCRTLRPGLAQEIFMPRSRHAFLALAAGLATTLAAAQSAPTAAGEGSNFTQHKQQELTRINTHLQILQTLQSCVQSAANPADMKRCNEVARAARPHGG
jgi:hypothetical protein